MITAEKIRINLLEHNLNQRISHFSSFNSAS